MQTVRSDAVKRGVVENNDTVSAACETSESQQGVVRLDHDVTNLILIGENTVCLQEFLRELIPEPVPPAIEWHNTKPSRLSLPSASRKTENEIL